MTSGQENEVHFESRKWIVKFTIVS
jgi:hypothetical protein